MTMPPLVLSSAWRARELTRNFAHPRAIYMQIKPIKPIARSKAGRSGVTSARISLAPLRLFVPQSWLAESGPN